MKKHIYTKPRGTITIRNYTMPSPSRMRMLLMDTVEK